MQMKRALAFICSLTALGWSQISHADCRLCSPAPVTAGANIPSRPLVISISAELDFSRVAQAGSSGGSVTIDPATGQRRVSGNLEDLGGPALRASVHLNGEPGRHVRISLPTSVTLSGASGGSALVTDIATDLGADPVLGPTGTLDFAFGGRLQVSGGVEGDLRGRIQIVAEYQ
jgi:Domain of unknown function (DUF4402)